MTFDVFRQHSIMEPQRPETKSFQLGMNQVRKLRAITFNGEKRQIVDIGEYGTKMSIAPDSRQFIFRRHGFRQNRLRDPAGHTSERPDTDNTAAMIGHMHQ